MNFEPLSLQSLRSEPDNHPVPPIQKDRTRTPRWTKRLGPVLGILLALLLGRPVWAFPPAPHHLIFGMVRDELGNPVAAENAEIIFETMSGVKMTAAILFKGEPGQNYQLQVPMDSGITSDAYMPTAMRPTVPFKVRVRIGSTSYLPIEMSGDYAALGQPGRKTRLNLTLGVDSDGDGLPDAWERALIAAAAKNQTLADINPESDADGDGMSNLAEYLAGTYAWDKEDGFALTIIGSSGGATLLEFLSIRGHTYAIESSSDFQQWTPVAFRLTADGPDARAKLGYQATDVRVLQIEALPDSSAETARFFRLIVQ